MSRIGKVPITVPSGVNVTISPDEIVVEGSKGKLAQFTMPDIAVELIDGKIVVSRTNEEAMTRAKHGLMRTLLNNMVVGVCSGFSKQLEINGVGYKVNLAGPDLKFSLGYSHDINYKVPEGITAQVEQNVITISGISKQKVGQVAAEIRALRKPEPYKGKGIKYVNERLIRKSGKSGKEK